MDTFWAAASLEKKTANHNRGRQRNSKGDSRIGGQHEIASVVMFLLR
jgi:hypothetical protein